MAFTGVRALTFDVFGTAVDWFGTIVGEGERLRERYGLAIDWRAVARRWAQKYAEGLAQSRPWRPLDEILRQAGCELLGEFGIEGLTEQDRDHWIDLWRQLDPWPDAVRGLAALRERYRLVALSNANVALGTALARHAGLPWHEVLGPDTVHAYKPDPRVYQSALRQLNLVGQQVMMVAAHLFDLQGAKDQGFRTAFVRRPGEESGDPNQAPYVDLVAEDFLDLAAKLLTGASDESTESSAAADPGR